MMYKYTPTAQTTPVARQNEREQKPGSGVHPPQRHPLREAGLPSQITAALRQSRPLARGCLRPRQEAQLTNKWVMWARRPLGKVFLNLKKRYRPLHTRGNCHCRHFKQSQKTQSVGEDVGKLEPACTAGRNVKQEGHDRKQYGSSSTI